MRRVVCDASAAFRGSFECFGRFMVMEEFAPAAGSGEIYYLPGMGGRLDAGLGEELRAGRFCTLVRNTVVLAN